MDMPLEDEYVHLTLRVGLSQNADEDTGAGSIHLTVYIYLSPLSASSQYYLSIVHDTSSYSSQAKRWMDRSSSTGTTVVDSQI